MKKKLAKAISNGQIGLYNLKDEVIGIYHHANTTYLVLEHNTESNNISIAVNVTQFGAIQTNYGMPNIGHLELFPDGKNMNDMLNDPFQWTMFISKFSGQIK